MVDTTKEPTSPEFLNHFAHMDDVKTLRRSFDATNGKAAIYMISACSCEHHMVLGQRKVDDKSNEITAMEAIIRQ